MARKDALIRLYQRLISQREEIQIRLIADLHASGDEGLGTSDLCDVATDDTERELSSQLASLESRELSRIEAALQALREGRYGDCDHCGKAIPMARLQALPHSTCCVACQRDLETGVRREKSRIDWECAVDYQARQSDQDLTLADIDRQ